MKKNRYMAVCLLLTVVLTSYIVFSYQVSQYNLVQIGIKGVLLDVQQKQTWLDSENKIKSMNLVINSEIGFAVLYSNDYSERETVVEAGQSLLEDKWSGEITPAREFMLHGSTTGVNLDDLNWESFMQAREDLEDRATGLYSKKGGNYSFSFKRDMESNYVWEKANENENNKDE